MKRNLWVLFLVMLVAMLAACEAAETDDFEAPEEPGVRLASSSGSVDGQRVVACLPQGEDNVVCELGSDAVPAEQLTLADATQPLTIIVEGELGTPTQLSVASRETGSDGEPLFEIDLIGTDIFRLDVPQGVYTLDITAYYDDVEGESASYTAAFAVNVGQAVAVEPTASSADATVTPDEVEPTVTKVEATATGDFATVEVEETPLDDENATVTVEPTDDDTMATVTVTDSATQLATDDAMMATEVATEAPTRRATLTSTPFPTRAPTEEPSEEPTEAPTDEPTEVPTEEPTEAPTATATDVPTDIPTEQPTDEPTQAPTEVPTQASSGGPTPTFTVFPSSQSTSEGQVAGTPAATVTLLPTSTPDDATPIVSSNLPEGVAAIEVRVAGINYDPAAVAVCDNGDCVETALPSDRIEARSGQAVSVEVPGDRPLRMNYSFLQSSTFRPLYEGARGSGNAYLFNVNLTDPGLYVLQIELIYDQSTAISYFYQLHVLE